MSQLGLRKLKLYMQIQKQQLNPYGRCMRKYPAVKYFKRKNILTESQS